MIFSIFTFAVFTFGCSRELDIAPIGVLSEDQVARPENIDKMVTATYSTLGNGDINVSMSLWQFGDVLSDDAYKGGRAEDDGADLHNMEIFVNTIPTFFQLNDHWREAYVGVSRANAALKLLNNVDETSISFEKEPPGRTAILTGILLFCS